MPDTFDYPAEIERDEDGRYVVAFPDFGWGATDGASRDEALAEARDLLRELIATTITGGRCPARAVARRQGAAPGRSAGADRAESGPIRGLAPGRDIATPACPRSRCRRKRGAAHVESGAQHQGRNHRPRLAPVGKARNGSGRRGSLSRFFSTHRKLRSGDKCACIHLAIWFDAITARNSSRRGRTVACRAGRAPAQGCWRRAGSIWPDPRQNRFTRACCSTGCGPAPGRSGTPMSIMNSFVSLRRANCRKPRSGTI